MTTQSDPATDLRGARPSVVRRAVEDRDPLPGTRGFAGRLDGRLVRDVLGRFPLFVEAEDRSAWSHDPTTLTDPDPFPAGHVGRPGSSRRGSRRTERIWQLPDPDPVASLGEAVGSLRTAVSESLDAVTGTNLAVAFSGGVDSAILAARLEAPLYVVGFPESHDVAAARTVADRLDRAVTVVELDHGRLERAIPAVVDATGRTNAMDVSIALPLCCLAERVATDGFDRLALGQGADELFGGYAKVARAPDDPRVVATTVRGARRELLDSLPDQLPRDVLAIRASGLEPVFPLLTDGVVAEALALPGDALVSDAGERKWALRLAAREWLPDAVSFREKKAMQYGSLVSRELDRLARQAGFKRRMDDHVRKYVESLVA